MSTRSSGQILASISLLNKEKSHLSELSGLLSSIGGTLLNYSTQITNDRSVNT